MRNVVVAALAMASFANSGAHAAVNFEWAGASTGAAAFASSEGYPPDSKTNYQIGSTSNFSDLIPGLVVQSQASAVSGVGLSAVGALDTETVTIAAVTPSSGVIRFSGATSAGLGPEANGSASAGSPAALAFYKFSVTGDPVGFRIDYATSGDNPAPMSYLGFLVSGALAPVGVLHVGASDSGTVSYRLNPGDYLFGVLELAGSYAPDHLLNTTPGALMTGFSTGVFTFSDPVPEPSTWVMTGLGFGAFALAAARRRLRPA